MRPYYQDAQVTLYLGNSFEVLPAIDVAADLVLTGCPCGETKLKWDRWQEGWPALAASAAAERLSQGVLDLEVAS